MPTYCFQSVFELFKNFPKLGSVKGRFSSPAGLYEALQAEDREAIEYLQYQTFRHLKRSSLGLSEPDLKDIVAESAWILLQRIRTGGYEYKGVSPLSFVFQTADWLRLNAQRRKSKLAPIDGVVHELADADFQVQVDRTEWVQKALNNLPEDCQKLLAWRFFDEIPDKTVLAQGMISLKSTASIANRRCKCLDLLEIQLNKLDETDPYFGK